MVGQEKRTLYARVRYERVCTVITRAASHKITGKQNIPALPAV